MAAHTLLCVEPDEATLATIRGALEPHGFAITNITNGEEAVAWGRQNQPSLVIVSVEPRKVGYAICNKFKRSPELKDIPLILTSGEETPQQLEQHRKLKVKANEYLVKPFSLQELLDKVQEVYPLSGGTEDRVLGPSNIREGDADDDDILLSSDVLEEISIGDSDIVDDEGGADPAEVVVEAGDFEEESTQAVSPQSLEHVFDAETDAAFAAIAQQEDPGVGGNAPWEPGANAWRAEAGPQDLDEDEVEDALAKLSESETRSGDVPSGHDLFAATSLPTRAIGASGFDDRSAADEFGDASDGAHTMATPLPPPPERLGENVRETYAQPLTEGDTGEVAGLEFGNSPASASSSDTSNAASWESEVGTELDSEGPPAQPVNGHAWQGGSALTAAVTSGAAVSAAEVEALRQQLQAAQEIRDGLQAERNALQAERDGLRAERDGLQAERDKVQAEREQLSREIDEIKSRPQTPGSARDREILSLREVINKKERDLLDLRDQLDARERQILDHKDRIRENERSRRDLEDKNLGLEKALMDANERIDAITSDKQKGLEREKVLKARLDDAHAEIQKAHDEVESLKKRGLATEERLRSEMDRIRGELESRILEMEDAHRNEMASALEERANAEASLEQAHHAELYRLRTAHAGELEATQRKASEELSALDERLQGEILRMRKDHDKAVASLKEEHALPLAAEREAHQTALEAKERDHRNEILGLRRRHEEELTAADERRQKELEDAEIRTKVELEAAENRRRAELQARDEQHSAQVAEMDRRHFDEKTKAAERHRAEIDEAHARAARAEGDLAARTEELSEAHRRIAGLEADLDATRADLRDREVKLSQGNLRVSELELKTTQYEEQIMRSYQRLRSDDKVVEKAKRALAVALSLLEERGMAPAQGGGGEVEARESGESRAAEEPAPEGSAS